MSMETQTPLHDFALIGFAISFEMDYFNILQMLSLGKVKLVPGCRGAVGVAGAYLTDDL